MNGLIQKRKIIACIQIMNECIKISHAPQQQPIDT